MFKWLKNLFSSKQEPVQTTTTTTLHETMYDAQAVVAESPYVEGVTTEPVLAEPKPKKKRYYKPKPKAEGKPKSETSKPKVKKEK